MVFAWAFVLAEYAASQEHGWGSKYILIHLTIHMPDLHAVYMANIWNGFDSAFIVIFFIYFGLRVGGLASDDGL